MEITLPLHMTATCNHCPLPENLSKAHAFPPLPNQASALSAASPPDENTLLPNLAASGSEQVTNGTETTVASSPETEKCILRGRQCEIGPFAVRTFGQRAHMAIWCPAGAHWAAGPAARLFVQLPHLQAVMSSTKFKGYNRVFWPCQFKAHHPVISLMLGSCGTVGMLLERSKEAYCIILIPD